MLPVEDIHLKKEVQHLATMGLDCRLTKNNSPIAFHPTTAARFPGTRLGQIRTWVWRASRSWVIVGWRLGDMREEAVTSGWNYGQLASTTTHSYRQVLDTQGRAWTTQCPSQNPTCIPCQPALQGLSTLGGGGYCHDPFLTLSPI